MMNQLTLKAMAKINLALDVVRRRDDGYHEVRMIMQTVNLYDTITFRKTEDPAIVLRSDVDEIPTGPTNLIYKVAALLKAKYNINEGVDIRLQKVIPVAAGMAGGSTDAAAAFVGMNRLFSLGLSEKEMMEMAVLIGADVPYCICGGTVLAEGIGEILTPLPKAPDCFVVIAKPDIQVSTAYVYQNLHVAQLEQHPDIDGMIDEINQNNLEGVAKQMENVLETVTIPKHPIIEEIKEELRKKGAIQAMMSGSGPTVFAIFREEDKAKEACLHIQNAALAKQCFVTTFIQTTCIEM